MIFLNCLQEGMHGVPRWVVRFLLVGGGLRFSAIFLICLLVELRFSPAGESLFFACAKKSNQKKAHKRPDV